MEKEYRSSSEIRATDGDQGIAEAYLTTWGTVDSYNSTFKKGAFKRSFRERGPGKIRLMWNHKELSGKLLECREDDTGPWVKVQFNLDTQAGRDAYAHVRAGDVDCFSFGFNAVSEGFKHGVREIREVTLYEVGPVVFEANPAAAITDVRSSDFDETVVENGARDRGWRLLSALGDTLEQIFWENPEEEWTQLAETAIQTFQVAYLEWIAEWRELFGNDEQRSIPARSEMGAMLYEFAEDGLKALAMRSSFTLEELHTMAKGNPLPVQSRERLLQLPENLRDAHMRARRDRVEQLSAELRAGGFTTGEKQRLGGLLGISTPVSDEGGVADALRHLDKVLKGDKNE